MTMASFVCPKCKGDFTVGLGEIRSICDVCGAKFEVIEYVSGVHMVHRFPIFTVVGETKEYTTIPFAMAMGRGIEDEKLAIRFGEAWKRTVGLGQK